MSWLKIKKVKSSLCDNPHTLKYFVKIYPKLILLFTMQWYIACKSWLYCPDTTAREGEKSKPVWNLIPFCFSFIYYLPCSARVWSAPRARLSDKHDMNANPAVYFPYGQRYRISLLCRLHIRIRPLRVTTQLLLLHTCAEQCYKPWVMQHFRQRNLEGKLRDMRMCVRATLPLQEVGR